MSHVAIRIQGLGKKYHIGKVDTKKTLRESIVRTAGKPVRAIQALVHRNGNHRAAHEIIWALRDISFEINRGQVVGIIGRNGAGKSTLLKVLSRITQPTEGYAEMQGSLSSLLEVGTGFSPELTGRENIYLNGAILGMKKAEIERKFDAMVDFSGVEKFIDTPVKHYSSGMYLRLAFAVAAHLDPEILLVDEVLAVGDAAFQKKCIGKMEDVAKEGRTVLFVSHNMPAVSSLCDRVIWLDGGRIVEDGPTESVISNYLSHGQKATITDLSQRTDRIGNGDFTFLEISLLDSAGTPIDSLVSGKEAILALQYERIGNKSLRNVHVSIRISDSYDSNLFTLSNYFTADDFDSLPPRGVLRCRVPTLPLVPSTYSIFLMCAVNGVAADVVHNAARFDVIESDVYGTGRVPTIRKHGMFVVPHYWSQSG